MTDKIKVGDTVLKVIAIRGPKFVNKQKKRKN